MSAAPVLTIFRDGEEIRQVPLEGEAVLGRGEGCVIRLEDRAISRQHAVFRALGGEVQVERKSEFAPLAVNGTECTRGAVKEGDVVAIGPYLLRVKVGAPGEPQAPSGDAGGLTATAPVGGRALDGVPTDDGAMAMGGLLAETSPESEGERSAVSALPGASGEAELPADLLPETGTKSSRFTSTDAGSFEAIAEDAATKLQSPGKVTPRLVLPPGSANVAEFDMMQDEVTLGRGKNCDIILNDRKASRKNTIIRRNGNSFVIKDLDSANGTFVSGVRISEQELTGEDLIKIGDTEIHFLLMSVDYLKKEKEFPSLRLEVPPNYSEVNQLQAEAPQLAAAPPFSEDPLGAVNPAAAPLPDLAALAAAAAPPEFAPPSTGGRGTNSNLLTGFNSSAYSDRGPTPTKGALLAPPSNGFGFPGVGAPGGAFGGVPGLGAPAPSGNRSLTSKFLETYKQLPPLRRNLVIVMMGAIAYMGVDYLTDNPAPTKKSPGPRPSAMASKGPSTFEALSADQKRFVESQHKLAFDYYTNKDYDKALYEIEKIFTIVQDYQDSREIERYAKEGKGKLEAIEEEKKRKEEEDKLKAKVAELVQEIKDRMVKKDYDHAKELFADLGLIDPDNPALAEWKKEIEDYEEKMRLEEQAKQVQAEVNARAAEVYRTALGIRKEGHYYDAIDMFQKVIDMGASDEKLVRSARAQIKACAAAVRAKADPVLEQAHKAEEGGDMVQAYDLYGQAVKIDPRLREGYAGQDRIRGVLHDRAKTIYTEAILAESYSDFETAKRKFKECMKTAPRGDEYHDRAERKLARYFEKDDASAPSGP